MGVKTRFDAPNQSNTLMGASDESKTIIKDDWSQMDELQVCQDQQISNGYRHKTLLVAMLLLIACVLALPFDVAIESFIQTNKTKWPGFVSDLMSNSETFGHGIGVTMIIIAVMTLDERRRSNWAAMCGGSLGAGLIATLGKLILARTRPRSFSLVSGSTWNTFGQLIPGNVGGAHQSMPSGHTATAVGLATILAAWYPHGRAYFFTLAAFVGMQRMYCLAHYPSDVLAGAAVGWLIARACLSLADQRECTERQSSR